MNLFYASSIILSFMSFLLGSLVYLKDRKSSLGKRWFALSVSIAGWAVLLYFVASSGNSTTALRFQYLLDIVALGIPVAYLHFVTTFLGINASRQMHAIGGIAVLLSIFSVTSLFKLGVIQKFDFYWINPGPYYILFPVFFAVVILYSLFLLIRAYRREAKDSILRHQISYQILAGVIGFSGGATNFLPQIFNVFPFGNYFVLFYVFFISYSIVKYKLFNLKLLAAELLTFAIWVAVLTQAVMADTFNGKLLGGGTLFFAVVLGIFLIKSVKKEVEQREHIEKLAEDLGIANESLSVANEKLKGLDKLKSEFLSLASHQLRSPLTAIKGYTSMLLEGTFGKLEEKQREVNVRILESSQALINMVEDFLNVSKIEQGGMQYAFAPTDLSKMVAALFGEMKISAESRHLEFVLEMDTGDTFMVNADAGKLKQVFLNLVDNSIKYTPSGFVHMSLVRNKSNNTVTFSVKDSGVGVSPETKDKLFQKFSRGEGGKLDTGGSGIGLYLAQEITKAHKGEVVIESEGLGKGSSFKVVLPSYYRP